MSKTQLTVRGFGHELELHLRRVAEEKNISLNKAAVLLMRKGAGIETSGDRPDTVGTSLDHLMGIWSPEEAAEFQAATSARSMVWPGST